MPGGVMRWCECCKEVVPGAIRYAVIVRHYDFNEIPYIVCGDCVDRVRANGERMYGVNNVRVKLIDSGSRVDWRAEGF
jgi:hypothetical protein